MPQNNTNSSPKLPRKNILVTGGAGFIGSHFVKRIVKNKSYQILNLDKLTYAGNLDNLIGIEKEENYSFKKIDITDFAALRDAFLEFKPDILVNFAAETHVDNSIKDPAVFVKTNVIGTQNLLSLAQEMSIDKFVQISTDEVYGSIKSGSFTESSPLQPNSPYSASKAAADLLCRSYYKTFATPVVILRCTNNFGPNQFPEKLIPFSVKRLKSGKKIPIYGDGQNMRDWIFVDDFARAVEMIIAAGEAGEIYNVGANNEMTNIEIAKKILEILSLGEDKIEFVQDRPGHDFRYSLDFEKIRGLGWEPKNDFLVSLEKTVNWFYEKIRT